MSATELFGGRFAIERHSRSGGMAAVYRAVDRQTGKPVALKILHAAAAKFAGHFARESYVLAELDHPGIVKYVAHGTGASGELFLAMEWLEGEDLSARLKRGPLSIAETLTLGVRVAEALGAAHARSVVHRDIKPSNLFLPDRDIGRVKILDFGIARPQATRPATRTGMLLGTPGYMAPEQALGARLIDSRADVFALGCVLYECLVGRPAFEAEHLMVLLSKMLAKEPPRPRDVRPDVPAALDEVIARMLAHEPVERPLDGAAVAVEIAMLDEAETAWVQGGVPLHLMGSALPIEDLFEVTGTGFPEEIASQRMPASKPTGEAATMPLDDWYQADPRAPKTQVWEDEPRPSGTADTALVPYTLLGQPTRCRGREREIEEILRVFASSAFGPRSSALVVTGEEGIGKSRLVAELVRLLDARGGLLDAQGIVRPVLVLQARAEPYANEASLAFVASLVSSAAGLLPGDSLSVRRDKLLHRISRHVAPNDSARVVELLGELVDAPFPDDTNVALRAARQDARLMGDHVRRAFEDWLAAECAARPVLLIVSDLSQVDAASVALLEGALSSLSSRPLFVLATDQPSGASTRSFAPGRSRALPLAPLTADSARALIASSLGSSVDPRLSAKLVQRGLGHPLRLELLMRARPRSADEVLGGPLVELVSRSVEGLGPEARKVLSAAAVAGYVFCSGVVLTALGTSSAEALKGERQALLELDTAELIVRRGVRTAWGEEHAFRHPLIRQVVLGLLSDAERRELHARVGDLLERMGGAQAGVLATHFLAAGLPERAVPWVAVAAQRAFEASDFDAVLVWVSRGEAISPEGELRGALRLFESQAQKWKGEHRAALVAGKDAMRFLPLGSPLWYSALGEVSLAAGNLGEDAELQEVFEALSRLSEEGESGGPHVIACARVAIQLLMVGAHDHADVLFAELDRLSRKVFAVDPEVLASVHRARALRALFAGDAGTSVREFEAAAERFEEVGDLRNACVQRINVGSCTNELGDYSRAESSLRDALAQAERMGLGALVAQAKLNLGVALARQGQLAEALGFEREALATYARQGVRRLEGGARLYLGMIRLWGGDFESASREVKTAIELLAAHAPVRAHALAMLAQIELMRDRPREAFGPAEEAYRLLESLGGIEEGESLVRLAYAETLSNIGPEDEARSAIASAYERLLARAEKIKDPLWRVWFLEAVPENVRTMQLGRAWGVLPASVEHEETQA